jgi:hypothetical protein
MKRGLLGARKDCDDIGFILEEAAAERVLEDTKAQDSDNPSHGTSTTSSSE